jgi:hypothetical protein
MSCETAVERTCERCAYTVSSATADTFGPSRRNYPEECRLCGGDLVAVGGGADE